VIFYFVLVSNECDSFTEVVILYDEDCLHGKILFMKSFCILILTLQFDLNERQDELFVRKK
jgi:hypothetical protein